MKAKRFITKYGKTMCIVLAGILILLLTSCKNGDADFDDFDYQTVYFATTQPVRTIILGDDVYPNDDDNEHQFQVYATLGGVHSNRKDRHLTIAVDNSLCDGLYFEGDTDNKVTPLPANYYELTTNDITIKKGDIIGGVTVKLTDAFFADSLATTTHYVLPLRITSADDSILSSMDHTHYAVKYINKYTGNWLSKSTSTIKYTDATQTVDTTVTDQPQHWEKATVTSQASIGYQQVRYNIANMVNTTQTVRNKTEIVPITVNTSLILTFDDSDNCTITTDSPLQTVTGSGRWTRQGAEKAWGDKDRDLLELNYDITYRNGDQTVTVHRTEQLVMRDRGVSYEEFATTAK